MADYLEYTKGGYILIAPSLQYKHQYILKCFLCDEYFGEFEPFVSHCLSHIDAMFSDKMSDQSDSLDRLYTEIEKVDVDECELDDCEFIEAPLEYNDGEEQEFNSMKTEEIKEEKTLEDSNTYYRHIEIEQVDESIEHNTNHVDDTNRSYEDVKSDDDENSVSNDSVHSLYEPNSEAEDSDEQMFYPHNICYEDTETDIGTTKSKESNISLNEQNSDDDEETNEQATFDQEDESCEDDRTTAKTVQPSNRKVSACVKKFMRSDRNTIALIDAYRRQPLLWNINDIPYLRTKERPKCVQKIAKVLKTKLNIKLTSNEISGIIVFLRVKYKGYLMHGRLDSEQSEAVLKRLDFLRPFMENNYIAVLSIDRPYLQTKQISQILKIYKRYPILWNSNTIEYWCKNKRSEAIEEMINDIDSEMNLKVNHKILDKYLYGVHAFLTKEKRRDMGKVKGTEERPAYYNDLMFLYDYVSPFKCDICKKFLRNPLYFTEHMMEHDDSIRHKCTLCEKEFKSAENYIDHAKRHMADLNMVCKLCGKKFLKKGALKTHMLSHTGEKAYVCDICGISYRYVSSLVIHKRKHNNEYIYHCQICPKKFTSRTGLNTHMVTHGTERRFSCTICDKAFKTRNTLRHHEWTHEEGCHPCELCGKTFKHKYKVYVHMKTHRAK